MFNHQFHSAGTSIHASEEAKKASWIFVVLTPALQLIVWTGSKPRWWIWITSSAKLKV